MKPFYALIIPKDGPTDPMPPPGLWGGSNEPFPGYGLPPFGPGRPPGMWGGSNEPFPGWGLPPFGPGKPPGMWGGSNEPFPGYGLPGRPPGMWGGSNEPFPGYGLPGFQPPSMPPPDMSAYPPDSKLIVLPVEGKLEWFVVSPVTPGYNPPPGGAVPTPQ